MKSAPGKEILILEDSKAQAERLTDVLTKAGYAVSAARDGTEALCLLQASTPGLIISDVWMPKMNGYQFCRVLKQDERHARIPVILLTSLSEPKNIVEGLNAGADYYLTKPYSAQVLLSMVDSIVAESPAEPGDIRTFRIRSRGKAETITASPRQIVNFLFSTYESLVAHNQELTQTKHDLRSMNDLLEERIREKTLSLQQQVADRNEAHEALKGTLNETVRALARAVEMRDPYTAGHQMRVGELAFAVGRELGLAEDRLEGIRVMGFLHDIGKIIVPAEILTKPGRLNEHEYLFIKAHSKAGYDILHEISFPWPVATAVLQHHERLDGSGYPSGLRGDEIILEAKILAVADVSESMSSHRPYRPALGTEAALREIAGNKDVLYDPDAAEALARILRTDTP